jgi:hypothetical protein
MGKDEPVNQRRKPPAKRANVDSRASGQDDPVERLIEWQEHRYDPGYYTGANIHPLIRRGRPNRYGYVLIVGAVMTTILMILSVRNGSMPLPIVFMLSPLLLLIFLAGFKLIRGERPSPAQPARRKRVRNR